MGIELREDLVKQALNRVRELNLQDRITIIHGDIFKVDISPADVVFLYLTTSANRKLRPKLEAELKSGARVVSHDYQVQGWKPVKVNHFCENPKLGYPTHTLYLYRIMK